jgi:phosphoribosylanthranilate isomerase
MFVKVCGITAVEQIDWAVDLGYSAIGVVLHHRSVRYQNEKRALELADYARGRIATIAVGIGFDEVAACYHHFDYVQVYEYRYLERLIYAGSALPPDRGFAFFLYDTSRGSGEEGDSPAWLRGISEKLIISGGLTSGTVSRVIREYRPFGVDVSSGVEARRGVKDYGLMKQFIAEVNNAIA